MAFKPSDDPRLLPACSVAEAAHYLRMPEGTLRSWVAGRLYPVAGQSKRSRPLIHLAEPQRRYLSFINLVEAHVLAAIRRRHGVKLPKVRKALAYVHRHFQVDHLDEAENEISLKDGLRILSVSRLANCTRIWVITEADRSATTILLPEEH
jgi:hypothetical protein